MFHPPAPGSANRGVKLAAGQQRIGPNNYARGNSAKNFQLGGLRYSRTWFFIHYLTANIHTSGDELELEAEQTHSKLQRLEAVLFLSREGITLRKLAKLAGLADGTEARTLIRQLNQQFDEQGRAFRVEEIAGGYSLLTRPQFADWLRRFEYVPSERKLSQTAMETLAVVAYRQPVMRAEIEAIRGVSCSEVLKQLMEYELVRIHSRSEELGRPYLYGTTRRFLQMFGLRSIDRLPRMSWVNEPTTTSSLEVAEQSETEDSAMTYTLTHSSEESAASPIHLESSKDESDIAVSDSIAAIEDEENEDYFDTDDDDFGDDDDDFDDEDDDEEEWESDEDDDEESDDDDLEEDSEWEEVDDDDDGWVDEEEEDDEEDEDDDWEDEDEEDEVWD